MTGHRVRVFLTESYFQDLVIHAENWFSAQALGQGQSPVGRAIYLGEVLT